MWQGMPIVSKTKACDRFHTYVSCLGRAEDRDGKETYNAVGAMVSVAMCWDLRRRRDQKRLRRFEPSFDHPMLSLRRLSSWVPLLLRRLGENSHGMKSVTLGSGQ